MRTKFIIAFFLTISAVGFSQKKALSAAKKALKSGNLETANDALKAAEGQLEAADDKMKAQYYFLKGQVTSSSSDKSLEKIESSAMAYKKVLEIEEASGSSKYTEQANAGLQAVRQSLVETAVEDQRAGKNDVAAEKLYLGYKLNKADTLYLYYAASNAVNGKDYDSALKYYGELVDLGFNGIEEIYTATNKETGTVEPFDSKQVMDLSIKAGTHIKPETKKSPSKKSEITKNIALIYISQGKDEEAMKAMEMAKKENPEDTSLMQAEADIFYKMGNVEKYKEIVEQIVAKDPNNPDLLYNLGVSAARLGNNDQALNYYKKALELKPDYGSAQINIASIILSEEQAIVEEMNGLGTSNSDYKRYDALKLKRQNLYKSAVPYLEGALKSDPDNVEAVRTLMNIFYQLDDPKAEEMKNKLKALEGGN
ncbi:tetratricopeptide repeat protein [Aquimarina sp. 2201CG14-23]|uniref:tetratricopeptide repeat protein n=1 Tax=Aquimarina mycalae TaxID=3040073 RepID=UPI002477EC39|nr:tetratricopeptide repeat protein [Aquimarina sp. 2201CG14-23]MDH7446832.1 tetratricopeptide repeat protein [Aquimarina sp. 2201CG14-23]